MDKFREAQRKERDEYAEVQKKLDEVNKVLRDAFGLHRGTPTS